jgi:hypothetical protein
VQIADIDEMVQRLRAAPPASQTITLTPGPFEFGHLRVFREGNANTDGDPLPPPVRATAPVAGRFLVALGPTLGIGPETKRDRPVSTGICASAPRGTIRSKTGYGAV